MKKPTSNRANEGFTLIELLVTMAIIGILLMVVLALQGSTTTFTSSQNSQARRLAAIGDVSGYIGDRVKAAASVPDGLTIGGSSCSRGAAAPCLAVVLPVVDRTCGQTVNWALHAFRYVPRTSLAASEKMPNASLDTDDVYGIREVVVPSGATSGSCANPMAAIPTSFTGTASSGMLVDNVVLTSGQAAFTYNASTRVVTFRLRSVDTAQGQGLQYTPALSSDPYTLRVFARNVSIP